MIEGRILGTGTLLITIKLGGYRFEETGESGNEEILRLIARIMTSMGKNKSH